MINHCVRQDADTEVATIYVAEDDDGIRQSLVWNLQSANYDVVAASTGEEMLDICKSDRVACLLTDLCLPDMDGLELRRRMLAQGHKHPFVVITGNGNISLAVNSLRQGAIDFIEKPFDRNQLLESIRTAIARDRKWRQVQRRLDLLTQREQQVLELVVEGNAGKQIAKSLGISSRTVDVHRSNIVKKMGTISVGELIGMVAKHSES